METDDNDGVPTTTELDSHANMVVMGDKCTVFDDTGQMSSVNAFTSLAGRLDKVPVVDVALAYDCPLQAKAYILLLRNALRIPEMQHNLFPPFVLRKAGHVVDECPKFQNRDPTVDTHSMYIEEHDL